MQLVKLLISLAAAGGALVAADGCYGDGQPWDPNRDSARVNAHAACHAFSSHPFKPRSFRQKCFKLGDDCAWFRVYNVGNEQRHLNGCYEGGFADLINNCDHGGTKWFRNWHYQANPNEGQCGPGFANDNDFFEEFPIPDGQEPNDRNAPAQPGDNNATSTDV